MSAASDRLAATRTILDRLVGFDTTSRHSNLALIDWVRDFLAQRGVASILAPSPEGDKANLIALIGPPVEGGVALSGHTDVVPVDGQPWTSDPFSVREAEGRLYGRGVADMKTFLALSLAHVDAALAAPLRRPLILAMSYDEEVGCIGVRGLIEALPDVVPRPACVIVGEPTEMRCVSGHKGIRTYTVEVTGVEAHSSQTQQGASAIMAALPLMQLIADMAQEAKSRAAGDSLFTPAYTTMTIGRIEGGTAVNILARRCWFQCDLRSAPEDPPEPYEARLFALAAEIDAGLKRVNPEAGVVVTRRSGTPPLSPALDSPAERLVRSLTGDNGVQAVAFAAEAGQFQRAGYPTVICGPGSIAQAHQPDEWIAIEQLDAGVTFMERLIARLSLPDQIS